MNKSAKTKIGIILVVATIILCFCIYASAGGSETQKDASKKVVVSRAPDYTVYNNSGKLTLNIGEQNYLNRTSGNYEPWNYDADTSFTSDENSMIIEWKNKKVILKYYDKVGIAKESFVDKLSADKTDLNLRTSIKKFHNSYYFNHTMEKTKLPDSFGYDIITTNTDCKVDGNALVCDEQRIDFSQAVQQQDLKVNITKNSIEIAGGLKSDISYIDPTLNITGATTMCGVNNTYDTINIYSTLTVCAYDGTASTGYLDLRATNIFINGSGIIDANGKGYRGQAGGVSDATGKGEGPGGGHSDCDGSSSCYNGGGGAFGGNGGAGGNYYSGAPAGGTAYANATNVTQMGSAGGGGVTAGASGGGLIILRATNMTNNGIIRSQGNTPSPGLPDYYNGPAGGAGGGIWVYSKIVGGTGNFNVMGGNGYHCQYTDTNDGGGGAGGRILIQYFDNSSSVLTKNATGGLKAAASVAGQNGTFQWLYDTSFDNPLDAAATSPSSLNYTNTFYVYANTTVKINNITSINFTITTPNGTIVSQGVNGTYDGTSWKSASFAIGDRGRESDLGIWTWSVQGYTSLGLVGSLSGSFTINYWNNNTNIITGLVDVGTMSMPNTFTLGSTPILISGANDGLFDGYQWNGTSWKANTTLQSGLVDVGTISSLTTYYKDGQWQMIVGAADGLFDGYTWNGTGWSVNATQIAGLVDVGANSVPTVFNISGTYHLIIGENTAGAWNGRTWNGTGWQANTTVVSGLANLGINTIPYTFNMFGKTYLISGANNGNYYGYIWNGSGWTTNDNIITGLYNVVNRSAPNVLNIGTATYLISGRTDGTFVGFNLTEEYTPPAGDTSYPLFSNNQTNPINNSEYVENANYQFNITIENTNWTAGIEFAGTNYTMSNSSNVFNKTFTDLAVGTYSYYYWAYGNGSSHNFNNSQTFSYTIAKNSSLVLGLTATTPITYPTATDFTGSGCPAQLTCTLNISNGVYGVGTISANYSTVGNANYTAKSAVFTVTINQNTSAVIYTYLNNSRANITIYNNTAIDLNASLLNVPNEGNLCLYIDGVEETCTADPTLFVEGYVFNQVKLYNITASYDGNINYSGSSETWWVNVTQAPDVINPNIQIVYPPNNTNSTDYNLNVNYTVSDNIAIDTCWWSDDFGATNQSTGGCLNLTGAWVEGVNNITIWVNDTSGNENSSFVSFRIDTTAPYFTNLANQSIYDNESLSYNIDATDNGVGLGSFAINDTINFKINSVSGLLENNTVLSAGLYWINISVNDTLGNTNYSVFYVNVSTSADVIPPYFTTIPVGEQVVYGVVWNGVQFEADDETSFGSYSINDTTNFNINSTGFLNWTGQLSGGNYYVNITINDSSNNLNSTIYNLNITKATSTLTLTATTPITYGTPTDFAANEGGCPSGAICTLNITDGVFSAGTISANYSFAGNTNYSGSSAVFTVTINQAPSQTSLIFDKTSPQEYETLITPTCSLLAGSGLVSLTNGTSGVAETLGAGSWLLNCSYAGNTNYTASSNSSTFVISQNSSFVLGLTVTSPIVYPTATDFTGTGCPSQLTCGLNITNGVFGVGLLWANYSTAGNANYTSYSVVNNVTINKGTGVVYAYINHSRSNFSAMNDTATGRANIYLNGTLSAGSGPINLTLNGTQINYGSSPLSNLTNLSIGFYNFTASYSGNANWTSSIETFWVNISTGAVTVVPVTPGGGGGTTSTSPGITNESIFIYVELSPNWKYNEFNTIQLSTFYTNNTPAEIDNFNYYFSDLDVITVNSLEFIRISSGHYEQKFLIDGLISKNLSLTITAKKGLNYYNKTIIISIEPKKEVSIMDNFKEQMKYVKSKLDGIIDSTVGYDNRMYIYILLIISGMIIFAFIILLVGKKRRKKKETES